MKTLLPILVAVGALVAAPALADKKPHPHGAPPGQVKKAWRKGEHVPSQYYSSTQYFIPDPGRYRLSPPPAGYRWVLVDGTAYLVRRDNGLVADLVADAVSRLLR